MGHSFTFEGVVNLEVMGRNPGIGAVDHHLQYLSGLTDRKIGRPTDIRRTIRVVLLVGWEMSLFE